MIGKPAGAADKQVGFEVRAGDPAYGESTPVAVGEEAHWAATRLARMSPRLRLGSRSRSWSQVWDPVQTPVEHGIQVCWENRLAKPGTTEVILLPSPGGSSAGLSRPDDEQRWTCGVLNRRMSYSMSPERSVSQIRSLSFRFRSHSFSPRTSGDGNRSMVFSRSMLTALAVCSWMCSARAQDIGIAAQAPEHGGMIRSLGQPRPWIPRLAASVGADFRKPEAGPVTYAEAGIYHDITKPVLSVLGLSVEGYFGYRGSDLDGGFRTRLESPLLHFGIGYDQNLPDGAADFVLSFIHPFRRSGVFGHGTLVRVDWLPWRDHSFNVALVLPLQRNMGTTRPQRDHVELSAPELPPIPHPTSRPEVEEALVNIGDAAHWINRLTTPNFDQDARSHRSAMRKVGARVEEIRQHLEARTYEEDVNVYHRELERAFSIAASDTSLGLRQSTPAGREVTRKVREIFLDEVIIPYNRLLGMTKKPDSTRPFAVRARGTFVRWLYEESGLDEDRRTEVLYVFSEVLNTIEHERAWSRKDWGDSRFVWIPYQFALLPEDHDSQEEVDSLVERITNEKFTAGNQVWYVVNEQFHKQFAYTIHDAEDYHVLWIHDFRGVNADGDPDSLAYEYVLDYLRALICKVRRYDETGKMPIYMIFLDQFYYEANHGRLWMSLLESPIDYELVLPRKFKRWKCVIDTLQAQLDDAVQASGLLQAEAHQYGEKWLKNRVKVHVNITNPADPSFVSRQIIPLLGGSDNLMRDHRKIVFYDITEEEPYKGMAIYTGMGLGEHYAGATWEDRALMVQGPAALSLKRSARRLLLNQGFRPEEIPFPLREWDCGLGDIDECRKRLEEYEINVNIVSRIKPVMTGLQVHNQTGYHPKPINGLKATLYTLMPPGSLIKVPDSLWNNPFWAGMLVGASLRGTRVFVIGPGRENAPSAGSPQMSRAFELFSRLVLLQKELKTEIETSGGMLKLGIYAPNVDVADIAERAHMVGDCLRGHDFLRELVNLHTSVDSIWSDAGSVLKSGGFTVDRAVNNDSSHQDEPRHPMLHLKSQLFVSSSAWDRLMGSAELGPMAREYLLQVANQVKKRNANDEESSRICEDTIRVDVRREAQQLLDRAKSLVDQSMGLGYWPPDPAIVKYGAGEKGLLYLITGSQNMDYRGMLLDGEVEFVVSGYGSMVALFDFITLLGLCTWVDDPGELEANLPAPSEWERFVGRLIRTML